VSDLVDGADDDAVAALVEVLGEQLEEQVGQVRGLLRGLEDHSVARRH